ncbi:amino acid adenylation domain-containing protein [Leptothoe sp. ISB3NOV94-8A]
MPEQSQLQQQTKIKSLIKRLANLPLQKRDAVLALLQKQGIDPANLPIWSCDRTTNHFPLSWTQEQLWLVDQLAGPSPTYNFLVVMQVKGPLKIDALQQTLNTLVQRHEILRTTFKSIDGEPRQVIHDSGFWPLSLEHWPHGETTSDFQNDKPAPLNSVADLAPGLQTWIQQEAARCFDLATGPLVQASLMQRSPTDALLVLNLHHIIWDWWSMGCFSQELAHLYRAHSQEQSPQLPPLSLQYVDYACWQRHWLQTDRLNQHLDYWQQQLAQAPALLELPTDYPRPPVQAFNGCTHTVHLSPALSAQVRDLAQQQGVTLFMLLLTVFQILLHRYSGQSDILVGTPIANRQRPELESLLGFFVNTLVLRTPIDETATGAELLQTVKAMALEAYAHQDVPFEQVVKALQPQRSLAYSPICQVMFVLQNTPLTTLALDQVSLTPLSVDAAIAKFDLTLSIRETDQGLMATWEYNRDLFETTTIKQMASHFERLLTGLVADISQPVSALPMLSETERHQLLVDWNQPAVVPPEIEAYPCIHQLFEAQVTRTPDATALVFEGEELSYRQLNNRANQLAHYLRSLGVGPESLVGLCMSRSMDLVVGLLAILKAGGAYIPLDPTYPSQRLQFMLQDSQVNVLVTQNQHLELFSDYNGKIVCLDNCGQDDTSKIAQYPAENLPRNGTAENLAYVIYTSGSTGNPKGVLIPHRNVIRLLRTTQDLYHFNQQDCWTLFHSYAFDFSVWEIWGALCHGGRLVIVPYWVSRSPQDFYDLLVRHQVTVLNQTPSAFQQLMQVDQDHAVDSLGLRYIIFGGEALQVESLLPWFNRHGENQPQLINMYGITETTVHVTHQALTAEHSQQSCNSIGKALADLQIYVLDHGLQPVPIGVAGELHIGGAGLARGYLNRPELTAERFIANPFGAGRLYKTGDWVRYHTDGSLEYLGRLDHQVKIRGFRIELGEIETVLSQHPQVQQCIVISQANASSDPCLVAYMVPNSDLNSGATETDATETGDIDTYALKAYLKEHLPDYMVPTGIMSLTAFPLTDNGKIDRQALPVFDGASPAATYIAPITERQKHLASLFADVLSRPINTIGLHDSFFDLGGHSLLAAQLVARIRSTLDLEIPLRTLFESPTIDALDAALDKAAYPSRSVPPITPRSQNDSPIPLSFAQERLWFLAQLEQQENQVQQQAEPLAIYNIFAAVRISGRPNAAALQQALDTLVHRHESLRTRFPVVEGVARQVVKPTVQIPLVVIPTLEIPLEDWLLQRAQQPFDLEQGPLLRMALVNLDDGAAVLAVTIHHIISDGWSMQVLIQELSTLYTAYAQGQPATLPPLKIQYADYALWQRQWLQGEDLATQLSYWQQQLANLPPLLELPTDRPRPAVQTFQGRTHRISLPPDLSQQVRAFAQQQDVTLFMLLLGTFQLLLHRYSGQRDIAVGTPVANRQRFELEPLIGFFVNTLVLRLGVDETDTVVAFLTRVKQMALEAYDHQTVPFEQIVEALQPERSLAYSPLFQVMFALDAELAPLASLPAGPSELTLTPLAVDSAIAKFDLTLSITDTTPALVTHWEYNSDLFNPDSIERMAQQFITLLQGMVTSASSPISELSLLTELERHQLLIEWSGTHGESASGVSDAQNRETGGQFNAGNFTGNEVQSLKPRVQSSSAFRLPPSAFYPSQDFSAKVDTRETYDCIHHLFEAQVQRTPDAIAVSLESEHLSYQALNQRANQLAHYLQDLGIGPETLVGICIDRSLDMVVGLLGILKAGAAYVPIDPTNPLARLAFMLQDTGLSLLLTQHHLLTALPDHGAKTVCLDSDWSTIATCPSTNPISQVGAENLAYVIYTSGSTGQPKGILIEHQALIAFTQTAITTYSFSPTDRVLQFASISFDAAVEEIYPCLSVGATLVLRTEEMLALDRFWSQCQNWQITVLDLPTAYWHQLVSQFIPQSLQPLRLVIIGGERADPRQVNHWQQNVGQFPQLINSYGPTETTVVATTYNFSTNKTSEGTRLVEVPIGRPLAHVQTYVLDAHHRPMPMGIPGELYIGGAGLARGYLNQPALTKENFIPHPFGTGRLYKTGDRVRYRPDGNIDYLGRLDDQVKIRGFRIELGEIEAVLHSHPQVQQCVVVTQTDSLGHSTLIAYVVVQAISNETDNEAKNETNGAIETSALKDYLKQSLPPYMVPQLVVPLDTLPLTPNGKVDRHALRAPDGALAQSLSSQTYIAPRTPIELRLAKIWSEILEMRPISVQSTFFDLGGHSLLAVQLMVRLQQEFQADLPLAILFQSPTIEQLAMYLERDGGIDNVSDTALVPIQPQGNKTPLFCIHPIGGNVFCYAALSQQLGADYPLYGLQSLGLMGQQQPLTTIEAMAATYCQEIRTVQPQGPYHLAGWSMGGVVAYEMAQQLSQQGETVALLGLIDSYLYCPNIVTGGENDPMNHPEFNQGWLLMELLKDLAGQMGQPLPSPLQILQTSPMSLAQAFEFSQQHQLLPPGVTFHRLEHLWQVFQANVLALHQYRPQSYGGSALLISAGESVTQASDKISERVRNSASLSWEQIRWEQIIQGDFKQFTISGDHFSLLREADQITPITHYLKSYISL